MLARSKWVQVPVLQSGDCIASSIRPTTISSETSAPASMAFFASMPIGDLAATAARSISPVARWHRQCSFLMTGDWVPLPQPGGPALTAQR